MSDHSNIIPDPLSIPLPPEDDKQAQSQQQQQQPSLPPTSPPLPPEPERNEEQELIAKVMGFSAFNSTKGKMVPGNQSVGAVHVVKKRRYRQYMNRKGGFNRPLDKVA